jgi:hypothetical protein
MPSLCFVVTEQKQTYKPVPMIPPTSFSQLPFQIQFSQCCYWNTLSLRPNQFWGDETAVVR